MTYSKYKYKLLKALHTIACLCLLSLMQSCSSSASVQEVKQLIENPENGLTQSLVQNNQTFNISLWPANYCTALKQNDSEQNTLELCYFQLNTDVPEFMFRASEQNFDLIINDQSYPATIAFAENMGSAQTNRVMIGFPSELFTQDFVLHIKNYNQQTMAKAPFAIAAYNKIENLNIQ